MPHPKLTANRALRTTSASAAALALLALPLAGPAVALTSSAPVEELDLLAGPDEEAAEEDLLTRVLEIADRVQAPVEETAGVSPAPSDSTMEPAGSNYQPVAEPSPAPAPARSTQASQASTAGPAPAPPPAPPAFDGNGPRLQGWASHTGAASNPVQSPLVAGPVTVPAPQFADPAAVHALAGVAKDGWAAVSTWTPAAVGLDPYTPTQWPLAVAAGLLLLVGGGHVLRLYDESWKAAQPSSTTE